MKTLAFSLASRRYGIRLHHVHEIVRVDDAPRSLPGAPRSVFGLMDVRGRVVTLLHTAEVLGGAGHLPPGPHAAVLREPGRSVALTLPADMGIREIGGDLVLEGENLDDDPLLEGVVEGPDAGGERLALIDPAAVLEACREEVRSAFLRRATGC